MAGLIVLEIVQNPVQQQNDILPGTDIFAGQGGRHLRRFRVGRRSADLLRQLLLFEREQLAAEER